jgi:hypothetical protein
MALQSQIEAYHDCLGYYERALEKGGIRLKTKGNEGDAKYLQLRLHKARQLHREENARMYPDGHPMHGNSPYDKFSVANPRRDTEGFWWVYIETRGAGVLEIEDLGEFYETTTPDRTVRESESRGDRLSDRDEQPATDADDLR